MLDRSSTGSSKASAPAQLLHSDQYGDLGRKCMGPTIAVIFWLTCDVLRKEEAGASGAGI